MLLGRWLYAPRHLLVSFLAITVVPATVLGWLSWRLLEQDRALEAQRVRERLEHTADLLVTALDRRLVETEDQLPALVLSPPADLPEDSLIATFNSDHIKVYPRGRLLYYPVLPPAKEAPSDIFEPGEIFEYRQEDYVRAIATFRELSRSQDPLIRAGALVRLGRNLRKNSQAQEALAVYEELVQLGSVAVAGVPADLLARAARCGTLAELKQIPQLQREAAALEADLQQARWPLDRASYLFYTQETRRWLSKEAKSLPQRQNRLALAAAVEWLWVEWQQTGQKEARLRGRHSLETPAGSVLVLWRGSSENLTALLAGPLYVESRWREAWTDQGVDIALLEADGHEVLGRSLPAGTQFVTRNAADTRLPWALHVTSANPGAEIAQLAGRRRLLLAGLAMMALLTIVGGYFTARATARELAVARLQSDFVSAVSHEFRTPLTAMRHLTELLAEGAVSGEERRRQYYAVLARETERLHRLIEGLLDFGRMEAGGCEYRFEAIDPLELIESVGGEFQVEIEGSGHRVERTTNGLGAQACVIHADREALTRAIWNLLDNAVKYSPESSVVHLELARERSHVVIRIRDEGLGIPFPEQKKIFQKFVRGAASNASSVKGTGIGLAMVQHIVHAHRGKVLLQSEPGRGSTFTILLPVGSKEGMATED